MALKTILWIVCGVIWAVLIAAFIGVTIFNRIRNREKKHDDQ